MNVIKIHSISVSTRKPRASPHGQYVILLSSPTLDSGSQRWSHKFANYLFKEKERKKTKTKRNLSDLYKLVNL